MNNEISDINKRGRNMEWLWTWKGRCFGYTDGKYLWTYKGYHVGKFYDNEIYGANGRYLGELKNNHLITKKSKKRQLKRKFTPLVRRGNHSKYSNKSGSSMPSGYEDFPELERD